MKNLNDALVKQSIDMFVRSTGAEMGPPLGTVLGNLVLILLNFAKISMILLSSCLLIFY